MGRTWFEDEELFDVFVDNAAPRVVENGELDGSVVKDDDDNDADDKGDDELIGSGSSTV